MKAVMVYITARNLSEARRIGRNLVERRLVACVNILGPIRALYRWRGKLASAREVALLAKTTEGRVSQVIRKVRDLHGYEVPCIVAWPLAKGHAPFMKWIVEETRSKNRS